MCRIAFFLNNFARRRVLEWICILTGRKEGGKPFQKVLDTLLEIDPDGDPRTSKREINTTELKQNKKEALSASYLLIEWSLACSFSVFSNTVAKYSVFVDCIPIEQEKDISVQISEIQGNSEAS